MKKISVTLTIPWKLNYEIHKFVTLCNNLTLKYLNKCAASSGETTKSVTNRPHCFGAQSVQGIIF